jgi:SAM-dependent methyltransferase
MSGQHHQSDPRILNRRTLERDHRHLAAMIRPGMSILDIGCGTGSITEGMARTTGPGGQVTGLDRDEGLLSEGRERYRTCSNLRFLVGDALSMSFAGEFDIVTAARTLQWIDQPALALERMKAALRSGGVAVVLDYDHADNRWEPTPPSAFVRFYQAFLDWREAHHWDNRIGSRLPELMCAAGFLEVRVLVSDELVDRNEPGDGRYLWSKVIQSLGPTIVQAGHLSNDQLESAAADYREWLEDSFERQVLVMRTVIGHVEWSGGHDGCGAHARAGAGVAGA